MAKKLKVAVLMGGKSHEHEISLISGRKVVKNLNSGKYIVLPVVLPKNNIKGIRSYSSSDRAILGSREITIKNLEFTKVSSRHARTIKDMLGNVDVVFIAMHGQNGEDGTVQGFLELIGVPYTGSGVLASALGMNKIYSRKLFTQAGLKVPQYLAVEKDQSLNQILGKFKLPVFVKPANQGSSVGSSKVKSEKELGKALKLAFSYSHPAIVEEFLEGTEVTCAILGNDYPRALPLVEIVPKKEFFDYEAKYNERLTDEIVPARISEQLTKKAQQAALIAYQSIGCRGFGRVDMIIKGNDVYVLELNTIPGLTPVSLFPKAAAAAGISYTQLLDKIIDYSLENYSK